MHLETCQSVINGYISKTGDKRRGLSRSDLVVKLWIAKKPEFFTLRLCILVWADYERYCEHLSHRNFVIYEFEVARSVELFLDFRVKGVGLGETRLHVALIKLSYPKASILLNLGSKLVK